jgi:hypothetical protein
MFVFLFVYPPSRFRPHPIEIEPAAISTPTTVNEKEIFMAGEIDDVQLIHQSGSRKGQICA